MTDLLNETFITLEPLFVPLKILALRTQYLIGGVFTRALIGFLINNYMHFKRIKLLKGIMKSIEGLNTRMSLLEQKLTIKRRK